MNNQQQAAIHKQAEGAERIWPQEFAHEMASKCEEALLNYLGQQNAPDHITDLVVGMAYFNLYRARPEYFDSMHIDFPPTLHDALEALEKQGRL